MQSHRNYFRVCVNNILVFWEIKFSSETVLRDLTKKMADFDAIYEDQQEEVSSILDSPDVCLVPDPIIIRGAGNITV